MKSLRNLALFLLGVLVLTSMPSCKKDTMTPADKKIANIYYQDEDNHRTLVEHWKWNNDDFVESIENFDEDGGMLFTIDFSYNDKDCISRVDCYYANLSLLYNYTDKQLTNLSLYFGTMLVASCDVTYKDKKMSQLTVTVDEGVLGSRKVLPAMNPLSMLLPRPISERLISFEDQLAQRNDKQTFVVNVQLTWEGDNITKVLGQGMGETVTFTAEYDTKNNPVYGFLLGQPSSSLVKNNITMISASELNLDTENVTITYQYDEDDYPTMMSAYPSDEPSDKETIYIEYLL